MSLIPMHELHVPHARSQLESGSVSGFYFFTAAPQPASLPNLPPQPAAPAILVWEDGWHLPQTAALTGWLLVLISSGGWGDLEGAGRTSPLFGLACLCYTHIACQCQCHNPALPQWLAPSYLLLPGAALFSCVFPRRFWCRYVCPIGGMNGKRLGPVRQPADANCMLSRSSPYMHPPPVQLQVCLPSSAHWSCAARWQCARGSALRTPASRCVRRLCLPPKPVHLPLPSLGSSVPQGSADRPGCPMNEHSNRLKDNQLCALCTAW